jgi:hypothetical protein
MLEPCRWRTAAASLRRIAEAKSGRWKLRRQTPVRRLSSPFVPRRLAAHAVHAASRPERARAAVVGLAACNLGEINAANPARFYWHPYRDSASVPTRCAKRHGRRANSSVFARSESGNGKRAGLTDELIPCGSPFTSPTSRKTPEQFCAYARASALKPTLSNRRVFPRPIVPSAVPAWTTSMRSR